MSYEATTSTHVFKRVKGSGSSRVPIVEMKAEYSAPGPNNG